MRTRLLFMLVLCAVPALALTPATVTDSAGVVWTLNADHSLLRNGVRVPGAGIALALVGGHIQVTGDSGALYSWSGSGWTPVPLPVPVPPVIALPSISLTTAGNGTGMVYGLFVTGTTMPMPTITIVSQPAVGSRFLGLSGDPRCITGTITLTNIPLTCTATFTSP